MILKYLAKSVNLLNITLTVLVVTFAYHTFAPLLHTNVKFVPPAPPRPVAENKTESPQIQAPSPSDYTIIAEQNLFHPLRLIPVEKPPVAPLPVPEFVLFGTLLANDVSLAYIEDKKAPQSTPGRGKRQTALRKGEVLSGFVLSEIDPDKVVMVRGEEKISVTLQASKVREAPAGGQIPLPGQPAAVPSQPGRGPGTASVQAPASVPQQSSVSGAGNVAPAPATPATPATRPLRQRRPTSSYINVPSE